MTQQTSDTFWLDYITEAMSFAVLPFTGPRAEYEAMFGLVEEVGEVAGVFKRQARGDNGGELDKEKLAKELGDLLWYTIRCAMVCEGYNTKSLVECFLDEEGCTSFPLLGEDMLSALDGFHSVQFWWQMVRLYRMAPLSGMTLREVATKNLEKLRARKHAGTIQGSGDNR